MKSNLERLNELIEAGADFSIAVDHIVFDTECNRAELIQAYDDDCQIDEKLFDKLFSNK